MAPRTLAALIAIAVVAPALGTGPAAQTPRPRARDLGITISVLPRGPLNAITDVARVRVGQVTVAARDSITTGITQIHKLAEFEPPAEASGTAWQGRPRRTPVAASVAAFAVGTVLSVYSHESGHLAAAYLCGATSAHINLWPPTTTERFPPEASKFQQSFPALAGPLVTRGLAEGVDHLLNVASLPRWATTLGAGTYLAMRFDLPWQVFTAIAGRLTSTELGRRDDIAIGLVNPWFTSRSSRNAVIAALVASQVVDVYLDRHEIAENYRRLTGRPATRTSAHAPALRLFVDPLSQSIVVAWGSR